MQSGIYQKQDQKRNLQLGQNVTPKKTTAITLMLDQMVNTKAWKMQGLTACDKCRMRGKQKETMKHLLAVCKVMGNSEYLAQHNKALMIQHFIGQRNRICWTWTLNRIRKIGRGNVSE